MAGRTGACRDAVVTERRRRPRGAAMTDIALLAGGNVVVRPARCLRAVVARRASACRYAVMAESRRGPRGRAVADIALLTGGDVIGRLAR